jgi:FkbM family methyltransferase
MNLKTLLSYLTGYWFHKKSTLPIGVDLFHDIRFRFKYKTISTVFDVGANVGQTAQWVRHYLPHSHIYCFEPISSVHEQLVRNTISFKNIRTECIAFGEKKEDVIVRLHKEHTVLNSLKSELMSHDQSSEEETVKVRRIDHYCSTNNIIQIDLLKIDTEGFEMNVLKGASDMLMQGKIAFILCEVGFLRGNARNTYFADICEYLSAYGYYFQGMYQVSGHSWDPKNVFGNALFKFCETIKKNKNEKMD